MLKTTTSSGPISRSMRSDSATTSASSRASSAERERPPAGAADRLRERLQLLEHGEGAASRRPPTPRRAKARAIAAPKPSPAPTTSATPSGLVASAKPLPPVKNKDLPARNGQCQFPRFSVRTGRGDALRHLLVPGDSPRGPICAKTRSKSEAARFRARPDRGRRTAFHERVASFRQSAQPDHAGAAADDAARGEHDRFPALRGGLRDLRRGGNIGRRRRLSRQALRSALGTGRLSRSLGRQGAADFDLRHPRGGRNAPGRRWRSWSSRAT